MKTCILSNNANWTEQIKTAILQNDSNDEIITFNTAVRFLIDIPHKSCDVIIIDWILRDFDGFELLEEIATIKQDYIILLVSPINNREVIEEATSLGVSYYFQYQTPPEVIASRAKTIYSRKVAGVKPMRTYVTPPRLVAPSEISIDEKIANMFMHIGVPPHIRGYQYLRTGIKIAVGEPAIINTVTKRLYPEIAKAYDTSASKVERAIRHAIFVTWNRGATDPTKKLNGITIASQQKPTNSEFIALIADRLLVEGVKNN